MRHTTASFGSTVEDSHVTGPYTLQDLPDGVDIFFAQRSALTFVLQSMQDHLWPYPTILVEDELVFGADVGHCEVGIFVQEARLFGSVVGVVGFGRDGVGETEVDLDLG